MPIWNVPNPKTKEKCGIKRMIIAYSRHMNLGNLLSHRNITIDSDQGAGIVYTAKFEVLPEIKLADVESIAIDKTNCDVCERKTAGNGAMRIREFKRPHEILADPDICFLEQGMICYGPATRAGCGLPCINGNMPCRGCYGPTEGVEDQGANLLSAIGAIIELEFPGEQPEGQSSSVRVSHQNHSLLAQGVLTLAHGLLQRDDVSLLLLEIVGMVLGWRDKLKIGPLVAVLIVITLTYMVFHPSTRYRSPADPFAFVLAGYAVTYIGKWIGPHVPEKYGCGVSIK